MTSFLRRLSPSGPDGLSQSLVLPREISRQLAFPKMVKVAFDGKNLVITPIELDLD